MSDKENALNDATQLLAELILRGAYPDDFDRIKEEAKAKADEMIEHLNSLEGDERKKYFIMIGLFSFELGKAIQGFDVTGADKQ